MDRRTILTLFGAMGGAAAAPVDVAFSQTPKPFDPVTEWGFQPPVDPSEQKNTVTGTKPPRFGEISKAFQLLYNAPRGPMPIDVARYFEGLKDVNEDANRYNYEWPKDGRANPLIVGFFSSTFTIPSDGDQTSWCAAFVNFCLLASGRQTTSSALSGSFRNTKLYPATTSPSPGDIAVFRNTGPTGDDGHGHVAFYLSDDGSKVELLGGNQVGKTHSTGAVTVTSLPYASESLTLLGYRKVT